MKKFNVCFSMYCSEDVEVETIVKAQKYIIGKYSQKVPDELYNSFSVGEVEIDMSAELDKDGNILSSVEIINDEGR